MFVDITSELIPSILVAELHVYPIKSCAGISLDVAEIGSTGIEGDRAVMLVDLSGHFITQREQPRMALVKPEISKNGLLTVYGPDMPALDMVVSNAGRRREVVIWGDTCVGVDQGDAPARWFSTFLGEECRVVGMPEDYVRRVKPRYARREQDQVSFTDGYPLLLISEASLADLNTRMHEPLPMNRFRPNVVVKGTLPYAEDTWRKIRIGQVVFDVVKPCSRCPITTTDQKTAVVGKEPLKTLATYRRAEKGVMFGQYLIHANTGTIHLADTFEVVEKVSIPNFTLKIRGADTSAMATKD